MPSKHMSACLSPRKRALRRSWELNCEIQRFKNWKKKPITVPVSHNAHLLTTFNFQIPPTQGNTLQLLREFQLYQELVKRPNIKKELVSERETLLGALSAQVKSAKDEFGVSLTKLFFFFEGLFFHISLFTETTEWAWRQGWKQSHNKEFACCCQQHRMD